jgi:D-3-phosphoglycerate dehydrogenase / 2-oxoglutarate reductase
MPEILVVRSVRRLDRQFISKLRSDTSVSVLCTASSGLDNIDVSFAQECGMSVLNVASGNYVSAAEHTFTLILSAAKNLTKYDALMKEGRFESSVFTNLEMAGKTIGIIGVGRVGSRVAHFAKAFNMKILGNDIRKSLTHKYRWIKFVNLERLLQISDIVTVHVPLNKSTRNFLSRANLKKLKKDAIFVNCSRGGIVSEAALLDVLRNRKIFYAGLDVFQGEPDINKTFAKLNNVILTPHVAGKTRESSERISFLLAKSIIQFYSKNSRKFYVNS